MQRKIVRSEGHGLRSCAVTFLVTWQWASAAPALLQRAAATALAMIAYTARPTGAHEKHGCCSLCVSGADYAKTVLFLVNGVFKCKLLHAWVCCIACRTGFF